DSPVGPEKAAGPIEVRQPPRFAIVTPSLNQGRFLKRTIDSVLDQRYPQLDYIVVDGGSTDESVEVLKSYGDRLRWLCEPDRGQTDAINKGLAHTRGDLLAYLNSDDVLMPGALARAADYFNQHPDWDVIYGQAHYIDEDDRIVGRHPTDAYSFSRLLEDC